MNYLQLNDRFKWQVFAKKITLSILSLSAISYEAIAGNLPLPATIQAESYFAMKGISTAAAVDSGGGSYVGWTDATDWLSYASKPVRIPTTGSYKISYRVSSLEGGGSFTFRRTNNGAIYDKVVVPRTGGWQKWTTISRTVTLPAGLHTFGMTVITSGFNINWFKIESLSSASSSSRPAVTPSKPASSRPASTKPVSSKATSSAANTGNSNNASVQINGPVGISWTAPKLRQGGGVLDITEVGGYKIRYKLTSAANFTYITINDAWTNFYNFSWLEGTYIFQIAAYDKDGKYSDYVNILRK